MNLIPVQMLPDYSAIEAIFERYVSSDVLAEYRLPISDYRARVIVGLSGGADSSVLALFAAVYLARHYPNIEYLFTDTKAEPDSCYETLDKLERLLGISIKRVTPEKGLFDRINEYNGFLPNTSARWCTRELKVDPLKVYITQSTNSGGVVSLAGIRFDEADREGVSFQYSMENKGAAFPFIDLKITKEVVFSILSETIGIPATYAFRSRSGCFSCFFQRNAELLGMLVNDPQAYAKTESFEKLSPADEARWNTPPTSLASLGIRGYYPVPAFVDIRKAERAPERQPGALKPAKTNPTPDLFDSDPSPEVEEDELFAAFALYTDDRLGLFGGRQFTPGVYWQEFITISTSLSGLKTSLGTYYKFKKTTPMPHYDVDDLRIVIAQLRFPRGTIDKAPPGRESFTWKSNVSLKQLRHLATHCLTTLERLDLDRRYSDAVALMRTAGNMDDARDAAEEVLATRALLDKAPPATGRVIWEGIYTPTVEVSAAVQLQLDGISVDSTIKPAREGLEFDEVPRACIACSL